MKIIKNIALISLILVLFGSCEDFLDVNTDPNNPTQVTPDLVLPVAQNYTANIIQRDRGINHIGNMFMYNWSQSDGFSWYEDEFSYLVTTSFYTQIFEFTYSKALKQYQVLNNYEGAEYDNYKAIAEIMKAFHFQLLVDFYGDIPYSEALLRSENASPKYDDAQTVYENLIVDLTDAISVIDNADEFALVPGNDDAMFGGDMTEWKKFANTVKLRILTRQMSMPGREAYIQKEFDVIAAEGSGFITDNVGINPGYIEGEENKQNRMWDDLGYDSAGNTKMSNDATCATQYVLDYLTSTNDDRVDFIYETEAGYLGVEQGITTNSDYAADNVANIGPGILKSGDMDAIIYTLAESYFNQAEAAYRGYLATDAKSLYEAGITASYKYLGVETKDSDGNVVVSAEQHASGYYVQNVPNVGWDASADKLEAIITQKWIAVNGINAEQSWFDYSRTGFPSNLPISAKATGVTDRPVRLYYPASEISTNGSNVPSQPDAFTAKIFWAN